MKPATPCQSCPWRKSNPPGGANIPGFSLDKMRRLRATVGEGDAFRTVMACHYSACGDERPCIGYVAVEGMSNINVRLMAIQGDIDLDAIYAAAKDLDLWPSFDAMLQAFEEVLQRENPKCESD